MSTEASGSTAASTSNDAKVTSNVTLSELVWISNQVLLSDVVNQRKNFEQFIESLSIVLPNCGVMSQGMSTQLLFIKKKFALMKLGVHFGLPYEIVRDRMIEVWKQNYPESVLVSPMDDSGIIRKTINMTYDHCWWNPSYVESSIDNIQSIKPEIISDKSKQVIVK